MLNYIPRRLRQIVFAVVVALIGCNCEQDKFSGIDGKEGGTIDTGLPHENANDSGEFTPDNNENDEKTLEILGTMFDGPLASSELAGNALLETEDAVLEEFTYWNKKYIKPTFCPPDELINGNLKLYESTLNESKLGRVVCDKRDMAFFKYRRSDYSKSFIVAQSGGSDGQLVFCASIKSEIDEKKSAWYYKLAKKYVKLPKEIISDMLMVTGAKRAGINTIAVLEGYNDWGFAKRLRVTPFAKMKVVQNRGMVCISVDKGPRNSTESPRPIPNCSWMRAAREGMNRNRRRNELKQSITALQAKRPEWLVEEDAIDEQYQDARRLIRKERKNKELYSVLDRVLRFEKLGGVNADTYRIDVTGRIIAVLKYVPEIDDKSKREKLVEQIMTLISRKDYVVFDRPVKKSNSNSVMAIITLLSSARTESDELKLFDKVKHVDNGGDLFCVATALDTTKADDRMSKAVVSAIWQSENRASLDVLAWLLARSENKAARESAAFGLTRYLRGRITKRNLMKNKKD